MRLTREPCEASLHPWTARCRPQICTTPIRVIERSAGNTRWAWKIRATNIAFALLCYQFASSKARSRGSERSVPACGAIFRRGMGVSFCAGSIVFPPQKRPCNQDKKKTQQGLNLIKTQKASNPPDLRHQLSNSRFLRFSADGNLSSN